MAAAALENKYLGAPQQCNLEYKYFIVWFKLNNKII